MCTTNARAGILGFAGRLHGETPLLHGDGSPRCVKKCQNCKNLPINGIVYFHHGDNILYTRFNNYVRGRTGGYASTYFLHAKKKGLST